MRHPIDPVRQPWLRRLVLGSAIALALVVGVPRTTERVDAAPLALAQAPAAPAADHPSAQAKSVAATPDKGASAPVPPAPGATARPDATARPALAADPGTPSPPGADAAAANGDEPAPDSDAASEVTIDHRGVTVHKNGRRVNVHGFGTDREYDSFQDFVNAAPWLAGLVFLAVLLLFLTPLLIVALLIWYKVRKTRMQNETMLKLAERGVVPPAEAMESLASTAPAASGLPPGAAPLYEQARALRKRAAWSDLRKGVIASAVGLGLIFFSMLDDGTPNSVGLILLFVGIAYCVLWYFEDRNAVPARPEAGVRPPGGV